jgi:hypothetical protein
MGLLFFATSITCLLAVAAGVCVYRLCKRLGHAEIGFDGGAVTSLVWFAVLGPLIQYGAVWSTTYQELGLSGDKADTALAFLHVPRGTATDVCYRRTYQDFNADFAMSEEDFLAWMESQRWTVKRFTFTQDWEGVPWRIEGHEKLWLTTNVTPVRGMESTNARIRVLDGYCHYDSGTRPECSRTIIYDVKVKRVYVEW